MQGLFFPIVECILSIHEYLNQYQSVRHLQDVNSLNPNFKTYIKPEIKYLDQKNRAYLGNFVKFAYHIV